MAYVIGLVHGEGDAYGISYPDFPGCVAGGSSIDDAVSRGEDALAVHIESMLEDGEALPVLRSRDEILKDAELQDEVRDAVLVAVPMPSMKRTRVHVMIDELLLAAVDRSAEAEGFTRSGYFERAVRDRLKRNISSEDPVECPAETAYLAHAVAVDDLQSGDKVEDRSAPKWIDRWRKSHGGAEGESETCEGLVRELILSNKAVAASHFWPPVFGLSGDAFQNGLCTKNVVLLMSPLPSGDRSFVVRGRPPDSKKTSLNKVFSK